MLLFRNIREVFLWYWLRDHVSIIDKSDFTRKNAAKLQFFFDICKYFYHNAYYFCDFVAK